MQKYIAGANVERHRISVVSLTNLQEHIAAYGSTLVPKEVFGEGELLAVFYQAAFQVAPAAFELMAVFLNAWQSNVLAHSWVMPDNFHVNIKVMQSKETRIQINELGDATFTTHVKINEGTEKGVSLVAKHIGQ